MIYAVVLRGLGYERKIYGANSGLSLSAVCCGMFILSLQTMYIALTQLFTSTPAGWELQTGVVSCVCEANHHSLCVRHAFSVVLCVACRYLHDMVEGHHTHIELNEECEQFV